VSQQKAAIRLISQANYNAHSEPLFKAQKILPLDKLILFFNLQIMQKFKQGFLPMAFYNVWHSNLVRRDNEFEIALRNQEGMDIPFVRLSSSSLVNLPRTWEKFQNDEIKILRSISEFKSKLKICLLNELTATVRCNRLLCHVCHFNAL
jgi:hypothetical protein